MTAEALRSLGAAIEAFKAGLPLDPPLGPADPWWTMTQTNLCCAEMLLYAEEATYQPGMHELAVNAARRMVFLVERLPEEHCTHLGEFKLRKLSLLEPVLITCPQISSWPSTSPWRRAFCTLKQRAYRDRGVHQKSSTRQRRKQVFCIAR